MLRAKTLSTGLVCSLIKPISADQLRAQMNLNEAQFSAVFFKSRPAGSEQQARCMPQDKCSMQNGAQQPNPYRHAA